MNQPSYLRKSWSARAPEIERPGVQSPLNPAPSHSTRKWTRWLIYFLAPFAAFGQNAFSQSFDQRGSIETALSGYPQTVPGDSSEAVAQAILQWDLSYKAFTWLKLSGGIEAQTDTHHETERTLHLDLQDSGLLRPAFAIRT